MDAYEKSKLADAFKEETYKKDDLIIREGEEGNIFYIVVEG
jgi:cAMP-dependent protein kinase regulator